MELEEIELSYTKELDAAEKEFLERLQHHDNLREAENVYKTKLKRARERYYHEMSKRLKKGGLFSEEKKASIRKEERKVFSVPRGSYELNYFQKLGFRFRLLRFKLFFHLRNFFRRHTPERVSYELISSRVAVRRGVRRAKTVGAATGESVEQDATFFWRSFRGFFSWLFKKILAFPGIVVSWFGRLKGKKEVSGGKDSEEKPRKKDA